MKSKQHPEDDPEWGSQHGAGGGGARLSQDGLSSTDQEPLGFTAQEQQDLACASKGEGSGGNYYLPAMTGGPPPCPLGPGQQSDEHPAGPSLGSSTQIPRPQQAKLM